MESDKILINLDDEITVTDIEPILKGAFKDNYYTNLVGRIVDFYADDYDRMERLLECYDPFIDNSVALLILKLLRYAEWNQYYYDNMSNIELKTICDKCIKNYMSYLKRKKLREDF